MNRAIVAYSWGVPSWAQLIYLIERETLSPIREIKHVHAIAWTLRKS
jgi:hypothetical protein